MGPHLIARFDHLERALNRLHTLVQKVKSQKRFLVDLDAQDIAVRNIQVAIEAITDIANSLVANKGWRKPESSPDTFHILADSHIFSRSFAQKLADWVRFRNLLIHEYASIDYRIVWKAITIQLDDLRKAAEILANFLSEVE